MHWRYTAQSHVLGIGVNQWILSFILPFLSVAIILTLYFTRKCDLAILLAWVAGFILGGIWEAAFFFLGSDFTSTEGCFTYENGPEFCLAPTPDWIPSWWNNLAHTFEDAGIFMIGVGLAWLILGRNKHPRFTRWHWGEFAIIWVWGVASEMAITWIQNGTQFYFIPSSANPAYYETSLFQDLFYGQPDLVIPYTVVPDAVWWIATIPFYAILLWLKRRFGGQYFRQEQVSGDQDSKATAS